MIITRTPFRMSFFGGGTDMPDFFNEYGGAVISTTFDKYCNVIVRHLPRFFEYSSEIVYSKIERISNTDMIDHPAVREAMKWLDMREIRLTYEADLPARSGLGTSSSFAVGMLSAFYSLKGKFVDKKKLADDAIYLERTLCKEAGGWQDQIAASFGGLNRINFSSKGYEVYPIIISKEKKQRLNDNLMLFFTGFTHFSAEVHKKSQKENRDKEKLEMLKLVDEAQKILTDKNRDINEFGILLDYTWQLKRKTGENVSTANIDALYETGIRAGALGGKLLGAGGGGFILFYAEKEKQAAIREALKDLLYVPFYFEEEGTRVIYYSLENYEMEETL